MLRVGGVVGVSQDRWLSASGGDSTAGTLRKSGEWVGPLWKGGGVSKRIHIEAKADHLLRLARRSDPVGAINELIWNALDAEATKIDVELILNDADGVEGVIIRDNGHGMPHSSCESYFTNLGGSWKAAAKVSETLKRTLNGKNGQGRIRGFALGERVKWTTVADNLTVRERSVVSGATSSPADFEVDGPYVTTEPTGTEFKSSLAPTRATVLTTDRAVAGVTSEFALFLIAHPDVEIIYNGLAIDPEHAIQKSAEYKLDEALGGGHGTPTVRVIEWKAVSGRDLSICDASGVTLGSAPPAIHAPGYHFTAYVLWDGFRDHIDYLLLADLEAEEVASILDAAREKLREHFRSRDQDRRREQVAEWIRAKVYPYEGEPDTAPQAAEREAFDYVATTVARHLPKTPKAQRATLRLMREVLAHDPSAVLPVLDDLYNLSKRDQENFANLLDRTPLSTLIEATTQVTNRLDFLAALRLMVFDPEHSKKVKERKELHRILEGETWVFGEQYDLMVSDKSLDAVLARHLAAVGRDTTELKPVRRADDRVGIVDLMLGRAQRASERREHLVVELKAPKVKITQTEVAQIKSYAEAVASDPQFAGSPVQWDFWIIGTELDAVVRRDASQSNKPKGQIADWEGVRIWAKQWSDIVNDCEIRLQYYTESLSHDPGNKHASQYLNQAYVDLTPPSLQASESA